MTRRGTALGTLEPTAIGLSERRAALGRLNLRQFESFGIVLRGSAFIFQAYGLEAAGKGELWRRILAGASSVTPLFLGATLAALSSGQIRVEAGLVRSGWFAGWTTPFAASVGLFALALFALLAAVYLAAETEGELRRDFRARAIGAEIAAGLFAALTFWRAGVDAPLLFRALSASSWSVPIQILTALVACSVIGCLLKERFATARILVAAQVLLVVIGWGAAMDGHLVVPDLTFENSGAQAAVRQALAPALLVGALLLAPSLWFLFRVFKLRGRADSTRRAG